MCLALLGSLGCVADSASIEPTSGEQTSSTSSNLTDTGPTCIGAEGFTPPPVTVPDLLFILQNRAPYYSTHPAEMFTNGFTNWYRDLDSREGLAKLAVMRGILERFNLFDMYLSPLPAAACPDNAGTVRMLDGTCNNLDKPSQGSAGVRFGRNIPPLLPNGDGTFRKNPAANPDPNFMTPSPREISRKLFTRRQFQPVPFLNMLAAAWVQFEVHDWMSHGENSRTEFYTIPLAADDPLRQHGVTELKVFKTASDDTRTPSENAMLPPSYKNAVTHWWDGSQVYGSNVDTANRLRSFEGGRLKIDQHGLLPTAADGFEDTGNRDNFWLGLALLHNLFSREHNAIADMLHAAYPAMTDQELFDKARMINAAVIAKIHTVDWTPAILPHPNAAIGLNANWNGLNKFFHLGLPTPPREARNNTSDPVIHGVVGGNRDDKGVPYTLTEEFVSVYRMHPLLPEKIEVRSSRSGKLKRTYPTAVTRMAGGRYIEERQSQQDLLYSFGVQHPGALVLNNFPQFMQILPIPFVGVIDMGAVDILRDRERGVPRYNDFREQLRLPRLTSLEQLTTDPEQLAELKDVYGDDAGAINRVDLLVGTLAEATRPSCYGFGETLFQVFTLMATRRLASDRFYTSSFTPEVYTPEGMAWIEQASMKKILLRQFPELADTGLASVANAFYPWE